MSGDAASARHPDERRFEEFFIRDSYITLKNYLYNYLQRKRVINAVLDKERPGLTLEVGSGLSPIVSDNDRVIYSELSHRALKQLKRFEPRGRFVVADGTCLPFRSDAVDAIVCSEVLEHVENDEVAIAELGRVVRPGGLVCITVPHRRAYYGLDDRYVRHFRRYEIPEMQGKLERGGLHLRRMQKVLGPLEKVTMWTVVLGVTTFERMRGPKASSGNGSVTPSRSGAAFHAVLRPVFKYSHRAYGLLARADAAVMPRSLAAVILFEAEKPKADNAAS